MQSRQRPQPNPRTLDEYTPHQYWSAKFIKGCFCTHDVKGSRSKSRSRYRIWFGFCHFEVLSFLAGAEMPGAICRSHLRHQHSPAAAGQSIHPPPKGGQGGGGWRGGAGGQAGAAGAGGLSCLCRHDTPPPPSQGSGASTSDGGAWGWGVGDIHLRWGGPGVGG